MSGEVVAAGGSKGCRQVELGGEALGGGDVREDVVVGVLQGRVGGRVAVSEVGAAWVGLGGGDVVAEDGRADPGEVGLGVAGGADLEGAGGGALEDDRVAGVDVAGAEDDAADGGVGTLAGGVELGAGGGGGGVGQEAGGGDLGGERRDVPLVAPVLEVGVEAAGEEADGVVDAVVGAAGEAVAVAVVAILADGVLVVEGGGEGGARVERWAGCCRCRARCNRRRR